MHRGIGSILPVARAQRGPNPGPGSLGSCLSINPSRPRWFHAGNLKPAKDKSTERIDGIVATIMAIGRALAAQEEPQPEYSLFFV